MAGSYEIHHDAVAKLLYGKTVYADLVPIFPALYARAQAVQATARTLAGVDSGRLKASIELSSELQAPYWLFRITGNTNYAYMHHQGTTPHTITGGLKFRSGARVVHARIVHHPGTRPNPFLRNALRVFL